jgi:hypothetical protein
MERKAAIRGYPLSLKEGNCYQISDTCFQISANYPELFMKPGP